MLVIQQRWIRQLTQTACLSRIIDQFVDVVEDDVNDHDAVDFAFLKSLIITLSLLGSKKSTTNLPQDKTTAKLAIMVNTKSTAALLKTSTKVEICLSFVVYQMVKL